MLRESDYTGMVAGSCSRGEFSQLHDDGIADPDSVLVFLPAEDTNGPENDSCNTDRNGGDERGSTERLA